MNTNEWALIIFTVVMQMAVGSFIILGGVHFFATRRNGVEEADKMSDRALLAIGPAVVFGLLVTLIHLGNPINAPRAIANIGTSWLSREILFSLLFCAGGAVFAFLQWRKLSTPQVRNGLALIVAALGVCLVVSMSMVYHLFSVPAWDSLATPATFFITTFLLGSLAMGAAFVANFWYVRRKNMDPKNVQYTMLATSLRWIALLLDWHVGFAVHCAAALPVHSGHGWQCRCDREPRLDRSAAGVDLRAATGAAVCRRRSAGGVPLRAGGEREQAAGAQQRGVPRVRAGPDLGGPEPLSVLCQHGAHWCLASATSSEEG